MPRIPAEDCSAALQDARLAAFAAEAAQRGRWPLHVDWHALVLPGTRSVMMGMPLVGSIIAVFTMALVILGFVLEAPYGRLAAAIAVGVPFLARLALAPALAPLAVLAALARVRRADSAGIIAPGFRSAALAPPDRPGLIHLVQGIEVIILIAVAGFILTCAQKPADSRRRQDTTASSTYQPSGQPAWIEAAYDASREPEEIWSEAVANAFRAAADRDDLDAAALVDALAELRTNMAPFFARTPTSSRDKPKADPAFATFIAARDHLLDAAGRTRVAARMVTPALVREQKLRALLSAYGAGAPARRRAIEAELMRWVPLLHVAADPEEQAAIWATVEPRTLGAALDRFAPRMRRRVLLDWLDEQRRRNGSLDARALAILHMLATAPDATFFDLSPGDLAHDRPLDIGVLARAAKRPDTADAYFRQVLGRTPPELPDTPAAASDTHPGFIGAAALCVDTQDDERRTEVLAAIAAAIRGVPTGRDTIASYWAQQAEALLAGDLCVDNGAGKARNLSDLPGALLDDDRAVQADPAAPEPYLDRARVLQRMGMFARAMTDYDEAVARGGTSPLPHYFRGLGLAERGLYDSAIVDFGGALKRDPKHVDSLVQRAIAREATGAKDMAAADFRAALAIAPDRAEAREGLARLGIK